MRVIFWMGLCLFLFGAKTAFCEDVPNLLAAKEKEAQTLYKKMLEQQGVSDAKKDMKIAWGIKNNAYFETVGETDTQTKSKISHFLADKYQATHGLSNFEGIFLYAYACQSIQHQDSAAALFLLSRVPVPLDRMNFLPISYDLATSKLPTGILLLFQAYDSATDKELKKLLLDELRADFGSISDKYPADSLFLTKARQWYENHKDQLEINGAYYETRGVSARPSLANENKDLYRVKAPAAQASHAIVR